LVDLKTGKIMRDLLDEKTLAMLEATAREHFPKLGGKTAKFYYSIEACPVFASHREGETPVLDHINYWLIKDTDYFRQVKGTSQFEATNIAASERILVTIDSKGNRIGEAESFGRNQEVLIFQNPSTGQEFEVVTTRSGKPFAEAAAGKQELADIDPNSIPTRHVFVVARTDQGPKKIDTFSPVGSSATAVYTEGDRIYLFQKRITQDGAESEWELTLVIDCPKSGGISSGRPTDEQRSQIKPGQGGVSPQGSSESVNWYPNLR